jgi:hypothetical protein
MLGGKKQRSQRKFEILDLRLQIEVSRNWKISQSAISNLQLRAFVVKSLSLIWNAGDERHA